MRPCRATSLLATVVASTLVLAACSGGKDAPATRQDGVGDRSLPGLSLDEGAKWKMDDHTRAQFANMSDRLKQGGDVRAVGTGLQADLDKLFQGCTMTGEAHNQLHAFLVSFIPAVGEMAESGSQESREAVSGLLRLYPKYFE